MADALKPLELVLLDFLYSDSLMHAPTNAGLTHISKQILVLTLSTGHRGHRSVRSFSTLIPNWDLTELSQDTLIEPIFPYSLEIEKSGLSIHVLFSKIWTERLQRKG